MIRKLILIATVQFLVVGCTTTLTKTPSNTAESEYPKFQKLNATKVVLVVLENKNPEQARHQDFLKTLAASGASLSNYYAVAHPSQPNYIALLSGSTIDVHGDLQTSIRNRSFLGEKGQKRENGHELSWKVYAEGYPSGSCDLSEQIITYTERNRRPVPVTYVRKHVPQLSFASVQDDRAFCRAHITGFDHFLAAAKAHSLPSFSLVIPSLENDAHDEPLSDADTWLSENFNELLKDPEFQRDVLLVVTFDENDTPWWRYGSDTDNKVFAVLVGDDVKKNHIEPAVYNHYDLLRTMETIFGIDPMAEGDKKARAIGGIWR